MFTSDINKARNKDNNVLLHYGASAVGIAAIPLVRMYGRECYVHTISDKLTFISRRSTVTAMASTPKNLIGC